MNKQDLLQSITIEMNTSSMQLYAQMQEEIRQSQPLFETEISMIEGSFNIAARYWYDIQNRLNTYFFKQKEDEIFFYKNIKPLFTAVMEYYCFRYKAVLFRPAWGKAQLSHYWINELKRIDHFYSSHREFYQYLSDGGKDKDEFYFSRSVEPTDQPGKKAAEKKSNNFYDDIAARILGYKQYRDYIESALKKLQYGKEQKINAPSWNSCLEESFDAA